MYVINKPLEEITEADLQYLIDEERIEKKVLEYKSELPRNSDSEKKEYLAVHPLGSYRTLKMIQFR